MPQHNDADGAGGGAVRGGCISRWWRAVVGEALATALLLVLGLGSLLPDHVLVDPALAFGCVIVGLIEVFGPVSGAHMNPAVTLAAVITGHLHPLPAIAYVIAQFAGGLCGWGLLEGMLSLSSCEAVAIPHGGTGPAGAAIMEGAMTATLVLVAARVWDHHKQHGPDATAPLKLGFTVAGLVFAGGKMTGAAINPARALAPVVWRGCWTSHWVYWVGPLGGAALAAALHRYVLRCPPPPPPRNEELPLHDKPDH